jgi:hypothetical protein
MIDINQIPTITRLYNKPILTSAIPADWCRHYSEKKLCAFCSKFNYQSIIDCSGSVVSVQPLQKSITLDVELVSKPLLK